LTIRLTECVSKFVGAFKEGFPDENSSKVSSEFAPGSGAGNCPLLIVIKTTKLLSLPRTMTLFGWSSYPSVKLEDIATKCQNHGIDATVPRNAPEFDYIIVGGTFPE
jgi:hypothetical protein